MKQLEWSLLQAYNWRLSLCGMNVKLLCGRCITNIGNMLTSSYQLSTVVQSNQMQQIFPSFCSLQHKMAKYLSNKCNVVDISMNKYNIY